MWVSLLENGQDMRNNRLLSLFKCSTITVRTWGHLMLAQMAGGSCLLRLPPKGVLQGGCSAHGQVPTTDNQGTPKSATYFFHLWAMPRLEDLCPIFDSFPFKRLLWRSSRWRTLWWNVCLFLRIVWLTEVWLPCAVATCALRTHAPLAQSCHNILKMSPLPTLFHFIGQVPGLSMLPP